ncbi:hypothetical protein BgiBS90_007314, partial [Biomphalaria glabrata]
HAYTQTHMKYDDPLQVTPPTDETLGRPKQTFRVHHESLTVTYVFGRPSPATTAPGLIVQVGAEQTV